MKKLNLHFKILILISALLISSKNIYSQWIYNTEPPGFIGNRPHFSIVDENIAFATGGSSINATYKTTNGGADWIQINTDTLRPFWAIWAKDANTIFAGDDGGGIVGGVENLYKTTNSGINWTLIYSTAGTLAYFRGMRFSNSMPSFGIALGLSDENYNIYKTRDGGDTWTKTVVPGYPGALIAHYSLVVIDSLFYAFGTGGVISPSIVITTDGGATWNLRYVNLPSGGNNITRGVAFKDDKLTGIAGANSSTIISRTTNGGLNWVNIDVGHNVINSRGPIIRWVEGTDICYLTSTGTPEGGVLKSTNGGLNWTRMTTDGFGIYCLETKRIGSNIYGYANSVGNQKGGDVILKVIDAIVGINQISELVPEGYNLSQNYPNPFNPNTVIRYSLIENRFTTLKVYDVLGNEVTTLVNEKQNAGSYEVDFDGSNYSSGVYFYKLQTDNFSEVKKMTLLK